MTPRLLLGLLAAISLCLSCHRFENHFDSVGSLCGVDPATIQKDELVIKLENPQGQDLSPENLLTTRSRFVSATRRSQMLAISPRGCVRVPAEPGVIQAFSSAQGWSLAHTLTPAPDSGLVRLPMQTSPQVTAELQCPDQGFYAHESLPFPLRWTSDGALQTARFEIIAENEREQRKFVLFEKPYGLHLTELPQNIRTDSLPEGSYQLRLSFQVSTEGWDVPGVVPNRMESCPLQVLHRRPEVGGLDGYALDNRVAVFAKGQILPWKTPSAQSDLLFCREKRGQDIDESGVAAAAGVCLPQALCQDIKNFQRTGSIIADELGVFDYYAYAEDRAGNRSSISCQTLVVTDHKPKINLVWDEADWNKPAAQMKAPRADVRLRVVGSHPQLEDAALSTSYQCKAEFVRDDQSTLSGRSIQCTKGRCKNKSMETFIPCDAELSLSLADLWPNMKPEGGVLRILVKADDRAGHVAEQTASLGIQPKRWQPTRRSATTLLEDAFQQLIQDGQGRIFGVKFNVVMLWNEAEQRWTDQGNPLDVNTSNLVKLWLSGEGELHSQWQKFDSETQQSYYYIFRWAEAGWQAVPSWDSQNLQDCRQPQSFQRRGFWCGTPTGVAIHEAGTWTTVNYPDSAVGAACSDANQTLTLVRDQQKTLWLSCKTALFQKAEGNSIWTPVDHALPLVKVAADAQDRVWVLRGRGRDDMQVQVMEGGQTRTLPNPASFTWIDIRPQDLAIGPKSEIILGDAYWDESQSTWTIFPFLASRRVGQRVMPNFSVKGELYWETEQGLLQWDGLGLRHWDLTVHGLIRFSIGTPLVLSDNGAPWLLASPGGSYQFPYQFHLRNWVYFPKPGVVPNTSIAGLWINEQSVPQVYVPADGLYTLESAGWNRSLKSPGMADESPLDTAVFEPIVVSPNGVYRWNPEQDWTRLIHFPSPTWYWGGTRDAQGRFWVYGEGMSVGVIDGQAFRKETFAPDAGTDIKGIFRQGEGILIATDVGLLSRTGDQPWKKTTWQDWGLESMDRIRQIDADTYLVSVTEGSLITQFWILDTKTQTKTSMAVPDQAYFLRNVHKTTEGDYIIVLKFDVLRTDGTTYTKVFSEKDLYSLPTVTGTFLNISHMQVDANGRIWFQTGYGVVRIDL